jgi:hypothetical protein
MINDGLAGGDTDGIEQDDQEHGWYDRGI